MANTQPPDDSSLSRQVETLTHQVAWLAQQVAELQRQLEQARSAPGPLAAPRSTWAAADPAVAESIPNAEPVPTSAPSRSTNSTPTAAHREQLRSPSPAPQPFAGATSDASEQWWQLGPLREMSRERGPVVVMALAGGAAFLLGTLYLVWYSVQQGWISPQVRLLIGGALGLTAMTFGWRLAGRDQRSVGGALAGAGLGGWFGTVLVARHVYDDVSAIEAFVLLAGGAAIGLVIANHRRLRSLATFATLGAYLTPIATSTGEDRLHELMIYQLVVVLLLFVIEEARRWPELGYLGLACTWGLLGAWTNEHLTANNGAGLLVWSSALLLIGHSQALLLSRRRALSVVHVRFRLAGNGLIAWGLATAGGEAMPTDLSGAVALTFGCLHLGLFAYLQRSTEVSSAARACLALGWTQLYAFGPLYWDGAMVGIWWSCMVCVPLGIHLARCNWKALALWSWPLPSLYIHSLMGEHDIASLAFAALASAAPFLVGVWPRAIEPTASPTERYAPTMFSTLGIALWTVAAWVLVHTYDLLRADTLLVAFVPAAILVLVRTTERDRNLAGLVGIAIVFHVLQLSGVGVEEGLLRVDPTVSVRLLHASVAAAATLVALEWIRRLRRMPSQPEDTAPASLLPLTELGFVSALALVLMFVLAEGVGRWVIDLDTARSLHQAGISVVWGVLSLGLLRWGLHERRRATVQLAFAGLTLSAAKLVFIDLVAVNMAWRVLSFMGLGVCLLGGAFVYRKLGVRLDPD